MQRSTSSNRPPLVLPEALNPMYSTNSLFWGGFGGLGMHTAIDQLESTTDQDIGLGCLEGVGGTGGCWV
jgi:hypothetical protein